MSDMRDRANEALHLMGEPPLGPHDVVAGDADAPSGIALLEPPGHKRSDLVFMNGRRLILDMSREAAIAAVHEFLEQRATPLADRLPGCARWRRRTYLELDTIDVVGENNSAVIARNHMHFSRRAIEAVQSIGHFWTKHVPGRLMSEEQPLDSKIIEMRRNAAAAKRLRKLGRS